MVVDIKKTSEYVLCNIVEAREGRKCVDGRYLPTQGGGMIARPGGDFGYVMALLALNRQKKLGLSPEQCFEAVYAVVSQKGDGHFYMHTDHHADPDASTHKGLIGCGHLAKAADAAISAKYGVDAQEIVQLVNYARNIAHVMPTMEIVNLEGEHNEEGVLVINSDQYTVNAEDPNLGWMYFIYDAARDTEYLKYLVGELNIGGVSFEEMKKESDLQLSATLHNLAKGLPIYKVSFEGKTPSVVFDSFVQ